ncbi:MAG: sugar phosphate isomerase/epimerase [Phycisphaerae bacterium]|nr:sugar phosphate isomerase/epimerase [Phycisphaerae bacterium]
MFTVKTIIVAVSVAFMTLMSVADAAEKKAEPTSAESQPVVWTLAVPAYRTLSKVTFFEAIDKAGALGLKAVEGRPYTISAETGDAELGPTAPPEVLAKTRKKLADAGLTLVSYYAGNFGKNEATMRKLFEFGKVMGIQVFVGEPEPQKLATLDKLANEFGISVAMHNHPKRPNQPAYTYWDPAAIMRMIEKHSKRIGCCADTGHWVRSGLDPVECLRTYEGRLLYLHLKDVSENSPQGHDVILGTGVVNVKGMLTELHRQKFAGQISFEYDNEVKDKAADVRRSASVVREIAKGLGQKVQ